MDEAEWLTATDSEAFAQALRSNATHRKVRLLACAFCRQLCKTDEDLPLALDAAERQLDALPPEPQSEAAYHRQVARCERRPDRTIDSDLPVRLADRVQDVVFLQKPDELSFFLHWSLVNCPRETALLPLLCDIFGNPSRPVILDTAWLAWNGGTIKRLAGAIHDERAFERMPILADALEDAGCTDLQILEHCRRKGPHARGCFVVDLLLEKS